jgi:ABC-type antimicrobial peptide transport system permease subunit
VAKIDPDQQVWGNMDDLEAWIATQPDWQQEHLAAWIFGVFAVLALVLASIGLYSVVSYTVAQRTGEFGIRVALGAGRADVLRIVFTSTLASVGAGIVVGIGLGLWRGGDGRDPLLLAAAAAVLCVVAAMACAIPAWRASNVDPMSALRNQ